LALTHAFKKITETYGDLIFDLCESLLWSHSHAQNAFRTIMSKIRRRLKSENYIEYEKSWILRIACTTLLELYPRLGKRISSEEQLKFDSSKNSSSRVDHFEMYFHRLEPEDQLLLLLKDKLRVSDAEISNAMAAPAGALKIRRQQALRALEEWLWRVK